jgi:hypothetical protein
VRKAPTYILTAAAMIGALVTLRASQLQNKASSAWSRAAQAQIQRATFLARSSDYVFNVVATQKLFQTFAVYRIREYRAQAEGSRGRVRERLISVTKAQLKTARNTATDLAILAAGDSYLQEADPYFVGVHLAREVSAPGPSPARHFLQGSRFSDWAIAAMTMNIPASLAFLFGALAHAYSRRRQLFLIVSILSLGLSLLGIGLVEFLFS